MTGSEVAAVEEVDESGVDTTVSTMLAMVLLFTCILLIVNVFSLAMTITTSRAVLNLSAEYTAQFNGGDVPLGFGEKPTDTAVDYAQKRLNASGWVDSVSDVKCGFPEVDSPVAFCEATIVPTTIGRLGSVDPESGEFTGIFGAPVTMISNGAISFPSASEGG